MFLLITDCDVSFYGLLSIPISINAFHSSVGIRLWQFLFILGYEGGWGLEEGEGAVKGHFSIVFSLCTLWDYASRASTHPPLFISMEIRACCLLISIKVKWSLPFMCHFIWSFLNHILSYFLKTFFSLFTWYLKKIIHTFFKNLHQQYLV